MPAVWRSNRCGKDRNKAGTVMSDISMIGLGAMGIRRSWKYIVGPVELTES